MTRRRFVGVTAAAAATASVVGIAASNRLEARRSVAPLRPAGLPPLRIALATDMHAPHDSFSLEELARAVRDFDPDLLLVAGDAINRRGDEQLVRAYELLPARVAKFASVGNWELQVNCDLARLRREYERAGVRLLLNEDAVIDVRGESVRVVGLDDLLHGRPHLFLVGDEPRGGERGRTLVMTHCPALFHDIARAARSPRYVFAGHTHGGQIVPFGQVIMTPPGSAEFVKGWYSSPQGHHQLYVSRGLGNSSIPFRVGSAPEIALLTL